MEYIFTERAHLMCPNMEFGIVMRVKSSFDKSKVKDSIAVLSEAHPFLKSLLGYDEQKNTYFYNITDESKTELIIKQNEIYSIEDEEVIREYERMTSCDRDISKKGMLSAVVWKAGDDTCFMLIFHHLLADGRGAVGLAQELADYYSHGKIPLAAKEKLISSVEDFPENSKMPLFSRLLVDKANSDWKKEKQRVLKYSEYHKFADDFIKENKVSHFLYKTDRDEMKNLKEECREKSVTVNDMLMAKMYIEDNTSKIIIANDIRDSLGFYVPGALGNYSTAFGVVIKKKNRDILAFAKEVHKKVQKLLSKPSERFLVLQCYARLDPGLLDSAFMASHGGINSKAARFIGTMFFGMDIPNGYSITNLGKIDSSSIISAYFIPPASPAMKKTQGVLTVNGEMISCFSIRK